MRSSLKPEGRLPWRIFLLLGFSYGPMAYALARRQFVGKSKLLSDKDITDGIAIGQVMPGSTYVDFVSYLGFLLGKARGGFTAVSLFVLPSFLLMLLLSYLYVHFGTLPQVQVVLRGLSSIMIALILKVIVDIYRSGIRKPGYLLISVTALLLLLVDVNIGVILGLGVTASAVYGLKTGQLVWQKGSAKVPGIREIRSYFHENVWLPTVLAIIIVANAIIYFFNPVVAIMDGVLFKIGLLTFGNGFTMLPFIYKEVVQNFHWLTPKEFSDGIVLGQITPGPVVITATFIGYKVAGFFGSLAATISVFLPSTMLVALASETFVKHKDSAWAEYVMKGILSTFIGLLVLVVIQMTRQNVTDYRMAVFTAVAVFLFLFTRVNPVLLLLIGIIASLVFLG